VAPHDVNTDGPVLRYAYGRPDAPNTDEFPELQPRAARRRAPDAVAVAYRRAMRAHGFG